MVYKLYIYVILNIESPIWMDSSTVSECAALEESMGGSMKLAEITGSKYLSNNHSVTI